jgi:hypothetical protein
MSLIELIQKKISDFDNKNSEFESEKNKLLSDQKLFYEEEKEILKEIKQILEEENRLKELKESILKKQSEVQDKIKIVQEKIDVTIINQTSNLIDKSNFENQMKSLFENSNRETTEQQPIQQLTVKKEPVEQQTIEQQTIEQPIEQPIEQQNIEQPDQFKSVFDRFTEENKEPYLTIERSSRERKIVLKRPREETYDHSYEDDFYQQKRSEKFRTSRCCVRNCKRINCSYAHSFDELRIIPCRYSTKCGYFPNCRYLHPNENKINFFRRTGFTNPFE